MPGTFISADRASDSRKRRQVSTTIPAIRAHSEPVTRSAGGGVGCNEGARIEEGRCVLGESEAVESNSLTQKVCPVESWTRLRRLLATLRDWPRNQEMGWRVRSNSERSIAAPSRPTENVGRPLPFRSISSFRSLQCGGAFPPACRWRTRKERQTRSATF